MRSKVLTFESWVTKTEWFVYAKAHPNEIPYLLSDRSQCQDPFFDLFAPSVCERTPMITGLCRCFKNFAVGDRYIYVTRLCAKAAEERGLDPNSGPWYLSVASMIVVRLEASHEQAASLFSGRRYVADPTETPHPPGLAHRQEPIAAVSRNSCIVHAELKKSGSASKEVALTPSRSTPEQWRRQYSDYHARQKAKQLRAAFCEFESIDGREALATRFEDAPVSSNADWEGKSQNVNGVIILEATAKSLAGRIAEHGTKDDSVIR